MLLPEITAICGDGLAKSYYDFVYPRLPADLDRAEKEFAATRFYAPNAIPYLLYRAGKLPLPEICNQKESEGSYCYDMRYPKPGIGFFQYIYCHLAEESWEILERVLQDLRSGLYPRKGKQVAECCG